MTTPRFFIMASGRRCLVLEEGIDYDLFPAAAARWATRCDLRIVEKLDGVSERLWGCESSGHQLWLAYDDWFPQINLEPRDDQATAEIERIGLVIGARE